MSRSTRDSLRELATSDGVTMDEELQRLVRKERQHRMGDALASQEFDEADEAWLQVGISTVKER